ncbi:hypothetical protein LSUE1_G009591 [Lachnellula suecica]|uniref:Aminoglycoside phosphotransferase domain-containing protein n=1 Tax=Lachnellula suecica TaxID=602035 RepID=A0A8T9BR26_9HELO|nr:hypothetical protein LSUE1_G009591 [Lachnellula suecica]
MASVSGDTVIEALLLIENAKLPHPSAPLLASYITEALHPRLAADYVLKLCHAGHHQRTGLLSLVSDWNYLVESILQRGCSPQKPDAETQAAIVRRDGARCCITGKTGRFGDPLVIVPVSKPPLAGLMTSIRYARCLFHSPYRDWWLAYAQNPDDMYPYHNHWLVRKSAATAFAQCFIKLDRLQPSMIEYEAMHVYLGLIDKPLELEGCFPLLGDHSRSRIQKVDARFLGTQARLCKSFRWLEIAKQVALDQEARTTPSKNHAKGSKKGLERDKKNNPSLGGLLGSVCLAVWLVVPARARVAAYKLLRKAGDYLYGAPDATAQVRRLPFGLYLKYLGDPDGFRNEFNALQIVRRYTSIPVPRPLDVVSIPSTSSDPFYSYDAYLLTTRVPGTCLSLCEDMFSDQDAAAFVAQMQDFLTQLRAIPKTVSPEYAICNTLGGAIRDPRINNGNPVGPFVNEESFSQLLRNPDEQSRRGHDIVFTHADLNPRNILVDRVVKPDGTRGWEITGIVDWENSGHYPAYWDLTKSLFEAFRMPLRWRDMMLGVYRRFGDFEGEVEVEKRSWEEGDYI